MNPHELPKGEIPNYQIEPGSAPKPKNLMGNWLSLIPNLAVFAVLVGLAWWGHHSGWKVPSFSELRGSLAPEEDWCTEHGVPESICIECNESLLPKPKSTGWCKVHGTPECVLCNPHLAQLPPGTSVSLKLLDQAKKALEFEDRVENNPICRLHQTRIQFLDNAAVEKAGISVEPVWTSPAVEFISAPGEIGYNQSFIAHLSSRSPGTVAQVYKRLGDHVKRGDLLALVDSSEVGKAKSELLQTAALYQLKLQNFTNLKSNAGAVPEARVREAESALQETEIRFEAARQGLVNLGFPLEQSLLQGKTVDQLKNLVYFFGIPEPVTQGLDPRKTTSNLLPLLVPFDGVITSREVVVGEVVDTTRIIFEIVDNRFLWLTFDVKAEDAHRVRPGQKVVFTPDGSKTILMGKIGWISTEADPKTRTIKTRADLEDPRGILKANSFGSGKIIQREEPEVVSIPTEAIQNEGCCQIVFVRDRDYLKPESPKVFYVRKVRTGAKEDKKTEIIAGLLPGELVVTKGSGLLLNELLRGNLGEGCACHPKK